MDAVTPQLLQSIIQSRQTVEFREASEKAYRNFYDVERRIDDLLKFLCV